MRILPSLILLILLVGGAAASTSITHSYQGWTTRSPVSGLAPFVVCGASGDGYGGACFPNLGGGQVNVRIKADVATTVAGMLWAYGPNGEQLSGDVICVDNNKTYSFRYNTGATKIVVGVGWWIGIIAACASDGTPAGDITLTFP